jgi:hypothetical protein
MGRPARLEPTWGSRVGEKIPFWRVYAGHQWRPADLGMPVARRGGEDSTDIRWCGDSGLGLRGKEAHRLTLSTVVATQIRTSTAVARTRGRGAQWLSWGAVWHCLIAWGGTLGGGQWLEAWFDGEVLLAEVAASRVLWALLA